MEKIKFLISPWKNEFIDIIKQVREELFVSSPYIDQKGVDLLCKIIKRKDRIKLSLITNLTIPNIVNKFTDPIALLKLHKNFNLVKISSLGRLHAKVYLIDNIGGIITSANLTGGGLITNFEYGVFINDKKIISEVKEDMLKYFSLGNVFDKEALEKIAEEAQKIYKVKKETDNFIGKTKLAQLLKQTTENLSIELLKNRVKEGKTINAIFSDTILYLLKKKGPLTTAELHPLIQSIHPDICDDSIDRVINGQHFGKKWKHQVRSAQQFLKKQGLIYRDKNGKWRLNVSL
jgi:HKD family nuclease